jgi:hypothetical protein
MTTTLPAFLARLAPPDFRSIAERGCFVYAYLRTNGSPYYIGIASNWKRPTERHGACPVPKERHRIRILRTGLSWNQACKWEMRYIARWGRKDIATGILCNRTDGGDGSLGAIKSDEAKAKMSAAKKAMWSDPERSALTIQAQRKYAATPEGRRHCARIQAEAWNDPDYREKATVTRRRVWADPEYKAKISAKHRNNWADPETAARLKARYTPEHAAKISAALNDPATKERHSAAIKAAWARRKAAAAQEVA